MDSITQAALGAAVGELVLGRRLGWRGAVWGGFFGTLPDLDILVAPFLDGADRLRWHRGLSHSLLLMVVAPPLLAKPLSSLYRWLGLSFARAAIFIFLVWSTHVLIDLFTTYGTHILEPFSNARVSFDNLFIVDLFFTGPLLLSLLLIWWFAPDSRRRRWINGTALALSSMYVVASFAMKSWATERIRVAAAHEVPTGQVIATAPTLSNIILWRGIVETDDAYHITYWSPFDSKDTIPAFDRIEKNHHLLDPWAGDRHAETLKWFAKGHWAASPDNDGGLHLAAMRLSEIRLPQEGQWRPVFQWSLEPGEDELQMKTKRPSGLDPKEMLELHWERICGKTERWEKASQGRLGP